MQYVRFREGLKLKKMYCPFCRSKKNAAVFQNRIRWMLRFHCGHIKVAGYLMPPDVLEDQGLANYKIDESPVYAWEERNRREKEREKAQSYDDFMLAASTRSGDRYTPVVRESKTVSRRASS